MRVLANSAEVGVPPSLLLPLGALKAAGAIGLIVGLGWSPTIGTAAAAGLTLFFVGAVAAHVRTSVFHNIAFPATYLALSATTLILGVAQS